MLGSPGFDDPLGRALACTIAGFKGDADLHVMMNMFWEPLDFEVPVEPRRAWHVAVDTFAASPNDIADPDRRQPLHRSPCTVQARSIVVLISVGAD
jgi:glycogen operon protein